jgi:hypothetical protein
MLGTAAEEAAYWDRRRKSTPRCKCGSFRFFAEPCPKCGALGGDTEECGEIFIRAINRMTEAQKQDARAALDKAFPTPRVH